MLQITYFSLRVFEGVAQGIEQGEKAVGFRLRECLRNPWFLWLGIIVRCLIILLIVRVVLKILLDVRILLRYKVFVLGDVLKLGVVLKILLDVRILLRYKVFVLGDVLILGVVRK